MNTENFITLLRKEIEKTGITCYSPDFPQKEINCSMIRLDNSDIVRTLSDNMLYSTESLTILIKGNTNDKLTRKLADKIFNQLDMKKNIQNEEVRIILITCGTPRYAYRDENQKIVYNIDCNCKVEWRNN